MRKNRWLIALACSWISPLLILAAPATTPPAHIVWPKGWQVDATRQPSDSHGRTYPGESWLALKTDAASGKPAAAIGFSRLVIAPGDQPELHAEFSKMQQTIRQGYIAKALQVTCDDGKPGTLDGLPSLAGTCDVSKGSELVLKQSLVMAIGRHDVYNLSYTAPVSRYANYVHDFESVQASVHIDSRP